MVCGNDENLKKFMESKIKKNPQKESVEKIVDETENSEFGKLIYVDYQRNNYINKYNDVCLFLMDNNYIPDKFKSDKGKGKKKNANKRTNFLKQCCQNFEIENNRLIYHYHYKLNTKTTLKCKIPYKEEVYPYAKIKSQKESFLKKFIIISNGQVKPTIFYDSLIKQYKIKYPICSYITIKTSNYENHIYSIEKIFLIFKILVNKIKKCYKCLYFKTYKFFIFNNFRI